GWSPFLSFPSTKGSRLDIRCIVPLLASNLLKGMLPRIRARLSCVLKGHDLRGRKRLKSRRAGERALRYLLVFRPLSLSTRAVGFLKREVLRGALRKSALTVYHLPAHRSEVFS